MPEESYPNPYKQGAYQKGLRRAIMERVSGSSSPSSVGAQVKGPLMPTGRISRGGVDGYRGRIPGRFPIGGFTGDPRLQPRSLPTRQPTGRGGGGIADRLRELLEERMQGLLEGGVPFDPRGRTFPRVPRELPPEPDFFAAEQDPYGGISPLELLGQQQPDPWDTWLGSIPPGPAGIGVLPEIPRPPGELTPEMLIKMLLQFYPRGMTA